VKSALKGTHFRSVGEVKLKMTDVLNWMSSDDLQQCSDQWTVCMQLCIDGGRGDCMLKGLKMNL
jgi:hypothetical protein